MTPNRADWLLLAVLPGLFLVLGIVLLVVLRKAFRNPTTAEPERELASRPSNRRLLWIGLGLGGLALVMAVGALLAVLLTLKSQ